MSSPFDGYFEVDFSTASSLRRRNRQRQEQQRRRLEAERRRQEQERRRLQEEERRRRREREQREAQERERVARERERQAREEARRIREAEERRKRLEAEELARKIRQLERNAAETRQLREARRQQEEQIMQQRAAETRQLREAQKQQLDYEGKVQLLRNSLYDVYQLNLSEKLYHEAENLEHELETYHTAETLEDFRTSRLTPFLSECRTYHERFENYLSLMDKYKASAEMIGVEAQKVPFDENFEAVLTELITTLEERAYTDSKREYIHQAMNEEMAGMGYKVVGFREMSIPSGGSFREELYQIDDDGVAASVIYQDNGQISIEIGALRSTDAREEYPLDDEMPVVLENHQRSFCAKAAKFEADMSAKGVTCSVTRQPPSGAHAPDFMIEDYKMQRDVKILASERSNTFSDSVRMVVSNG